MVEWKTPLQLPLCSTHHPLISQVSRREWIAAYGAEMTSAAVIIQILGLFLQPLSFTTKLKNEMRRSPLNFTATRRLEKEHYPGELSEKPR